MSSSTQKFQELGARNSEPSSRHAEPTVQRSPKPPLRRVELSGPKLPEPVSRRTEISIDISSKQVENSTSGLSRFGLKRADVGHKPPEGPARRTEITLGKPQELRRAEAPASKIPEPPSKIPEPPQRRAEPGAVPDTAPRRPDSQGGKGTESPAMRAAEGSEPALPALPQLAETKAHGLPTESPPKREEGECLGQSGQGCSGRLRELDQKAIYNFIIIIFIKFIIIFIKFIIILINFIIIFINFIIIILINFIIILINFIIILIKFIIIIFINDNL